MDVRGFSRHSIVMMLWISGLDTRSEANQEEAGKTFCLWWSTANLQRPRASLLRQWLTEDCVRHGMLPLIKVSDASAGSCGGWTHLSCAVSYKKREVMLKGGSTTFQLMHNKMESTHQAKLYFESVIIAHYFAKIFQRCVLLPPTFQAVPCPLI